MLWSDPCVPSVFLRRAGTRPTADSPGSTPQGIFGAPEDSGQAVWGVGQVDQLPGFQLILRGPCPAPAGAGCADVWPPGGDRQQAVRTPQVHSRPATKDWRQGEERATRQALEGCSPHPRSHLLHQLPDHHHWFPGLHSSGPGVVGQWVRVHVSGNSKKENLRAP